MEDHFEEETKEQIHLRKEQEEEYESRIDKMRIDHFEELKKLTATSEEKLTKVK